MISRRASSPSALVVAVPEARRAVRLAGGSAGGWRALAPHVTLLWPFVPASAVSPALVAELAAAVAGHRAFGASFGVVGEFPDAAYLAPDDPAPFVALTEAIVARWPEHPPYEGRFPEIVPHVTLREGGPLAPEVARAIVATLPVSSRVLEVRLAVPTPFRDWRTVARLGLDA